MPAFDAAGGTGASQASSWTHVGVGSNLDVLAVVSTCAADGVSHIPSSVTYGANAMSLLQSQIGGDNNLDEWTGLYGIHGQASGSVSISVTVSSATVSGCSASYTGGGTFGTPNSQNGLNTSPTTPSISTTSGNLLVGGAANGNTISSVTSPANSRNISNSSTGFGNGCVAIADKAGGGSLSISWSATADAWAGLAVEVQAPPSSGTPALPYAFPQMRTEVVPRSDSRMIRR